MIDVDEKQISDNPVIISETVKYENGSKSFCIKKPVYDFFKRLCDIVFSLLAMIILMPANLVVMLIIVIDDFGNPFYAQNRVGKNGRVFKMYKYRTMYKHANEIKLDLSEQNEYSEVHFKIKEDPRVTKVGKVLRRTSIDELPQLLNVFIGNMAMIGPRPFIESEQEQLPYDRLSVKPGLSCYWQCANTAKMPIDEQLELDYRYIRERSFSTDVRIVFMTIRAVLGLKNH